MTSFSENCLPLPVFNDMRFISSPHVKPFIGEWLATTSTQSLTDWKVLPKFSAQILDLELATFTNTYHLKVSDGCHWVYAFLDQEMGKLVKSGHFNQFDIVYLMKTEGNPLKGV